MRAGIKENNKDLIEDDDDITPDDWKLTPGVVKIVGAYAWNPVEKPAFFSGARIPDLTKIKFLVEHAGLLDEFRFYVTRFIEREKAREAKQNVLIDEVFTMAGRRGPLMGLIVSGLDVADRKEDGTLIDTGMAEVFEEIVYKLLPHRHEDVLAQARAAAPLETKEEKDTREATNKAAIEQYFNVIKLNNEKKTQQATATLKEFVTGIKERSMEKGHVVNNRYYVNLIHLTDVAIQVLRRRGGELPKLNEEDKDDKGKWYGKIADRFCFEIIANTFQPCDLLPARFKRKLRFGLYDIFELGLKADRTLDPNGDLFHGLGTDYLHAVNSFYGEFGCAVNVAGGRAGVFQNLLQAIISATKLYAAPKPTQVQEPAMSSNVGVARMSAANPGFDAKKIKY